MSHSNPPPDFAELRSLLHARKLDTERFLALIRAAHQHDPALYEEVWLPYLRGFPHHFQGAFAHLSSRAELELFARLLPSCQFGYHATDDASVSQLAPELVERIHTYTHHGHVKASLRFLRSPHLVNLVELTLHGMKTGQLTRLLERDSLANLQKVTIQRALIDESVMHALLNASFEPSVRAIDFVAVYFAPEQFERFMDSALAINLKALGLSQVDLQRRLEILIRSEPLQYLEHLLLSHNGLVSREFEALWEPGFLQALTSLRIVDNDLEDGAIHDMIESQIFEQLQTLDLATNHLTSVGFQPLVLASVERKMEQLLTPSNVIGDEAAHFLSELDDFGALTCIDLTGNPLSHEALAMLSEIQALTIELSPLFDAMDEAL